MSKRSSPDSAPEESAPVVPVPPEVNDFLTHLAKERDVSPNTVKAYGRDLNELCEFLHGYYGGAAWSWQGVDRLAMRGFLARLARRGLSKRFV